MLIYDINNPVISASNPTKMTGFSSSYSYGNCLVSYKDASKCFIGITPDNQSSLKYLDQILNNTAINLRRNDPLQMFGFVGFQLYPDRPALEKAYLDAAGKMWSGMTELI